MSEIFEHRFDAMDPNGRVNPVLENVQVSVDSQTQRITNIAVPFLNLYQPTALATNAVLMVGKTVQIIKDDKLSAGNKVKQLALTIGTVALSILMPKIGIAVSQCYSVCVQVNRLRDAIRQHNVKEISESLANIALSALYTASVITAAPEVVVISILAQAAFELYQASGEFRKGKKHFLEGMAKVAMAMIRVSQAAPMIKDLHRDYFGKQITQADLDRYMAEVRASRQKTNENPDPNIITSDVSHRGAEGEPTLDDFVNVNGYSRKINNLAFFEEIIEKQTFKKFRFYNCKFSEMTFSDCAFTDVKFTNCNFDETCMWKCNLKDSSFVNTLFIGENTFFGSSLSHVNFHNCELSAVTFNASQLYKTVFEKSTMKEASFLGATVKGCKIRDSDLTDTLFCGTEKKFSIKGGIAPKITKPVIAILWDHSEPANFASIASLGLKKCNAITLKVDYRLHDISPHKLQGQVDTLLAKIVTKDRSSYLSIGDELLNMSQGYSEIVKIQNKASEALKYSNGIYLPGGDDIPEQFYSYTTQDPFKEGYARTLLETSLLKIGFSKNMPILTACRGTQMLNVYNGGTLHYHVDEHSGVLHEFDIAQDVPEHIKQLTMNLIGNPGFQGLSMHHQGCDQIGQGLHVTLRSKDGLAECLISNNGLAVGTQFHPEFMFIMPPDYMSQIPFVENSINFFTRFVGLANERRENQMSVSAAA